MTDPLEAGAFALYADVKRRDDKFKGDIREAWNGLEEWCRDYFRKSARIVLEAAHVE